MEFFGKRPAAGGVAEKPPSADGHQLAMTPQIILTEEDAAKGLATLARYKQGKANLEARIVEDERWYQMRHWEILRRNNPDKEHPQPEPTSAWLFNSLASKHADAMDNMPEMSVLPRERGDEDDAKNLSSILPAILERADFEETYSGNWWEKLKHGSSVYGVFWDSDLENGIGDVSIQAIDLLNIFWEPGIEDIQDSRNVFVVTLVDNDLIESQYPDLSGKLSGNSSVVDVTKYIYDDTVDTSNKTAVVDWYYKMKSASGRKILHYAKLISGQIVFASQNNPEYQERGYYDHGKYPFVFDTLFPEKGTPVGFGFVSICRDPQLYIDKLSANIMEASLAGSKLRYFASEDLNINEDDFKDWNKSIVHVAGRIDPTKLQQIVNSPLDSIYVNVLQMKIDEMKETSSNRDVSQGGTTGGATAAAAIAALQEAGNKVSRDMIAGSYRKYTHIGYLCLELVRQFYDQVREFRILGQDGNYSFQDFSNSGIKEQLTGMDSQGNPMYRMPVFDIKIRAAKKSPFAREAQNQRALELYSAGFFNPENAQASLICLDMMEFEGVEKVRQKVSEGQTLLAMLQQTQQQLAVALQALGAKAAASGDRQENGGSSATLSGGTATSAAEAQTGDAMTKYGQRLAANAAPDVSGGQGAMM